MKTRRQKLIVCLRKSVPTMLKWMSGPVLIVLLYKCAGLPPDLIIALCKTIH